jgi:hypothetical protein
MRSRPAHISRDTTRRRLPVRSPRRKRRPANAGLQAVRLDKPHSISADLKTGRLRVLTRLDGHAEYAAPGQLRGDWATWVECTDSNCNVWREDLSNGVAESAVDPDHLTYTQLAPAVDRRGVVYFERALATCGNAEIRRWNAHGESLVLRLPSRFAYQYGYLTKQANTLYFDLGGCDRNATDDIYALGVASSAGP